MKIIKRIATIEDKQDILKLYKSIINTEGCTWNDDYPSLYNIDEDVKSGMLYCICDAMNKIIAVASAVEEGEWEIEDEQIGWTRYQNISCEVARVGVRKEYQGLGFGYSVMEYLISELSKKQYSAIHMLVSKSNQKALKLYNKLGFHKCGELNLYNIDWYCYEMFL